MGYFQVEVFMKRKTIYDVAAEAGVSISTVSRVINGKGYVSDEMRKKVEKACKDFRPIASAREIQTQKSNTIAVIISNNIKYVFMNSTYLNILSAITTVAKRAGYRIMLDIYEQEEDRSAYDLYLERRVDGFIILGAKKSSKLIDIFRENRVPFVLVGDYGEDHEDVCQVEIEDKAAVKSAVDYLINIGHTRIGIITGSLEYASACNRLCGYLSALEAAGIERKEEYIENCENMTEVMGENLAKKLLLQREPVTALVAFNDSVALSVYKAAQSLNVRIPDQLSVIGFDDSMVASYVQPGLTTVWQPSYEKGEKAANLLIEALESQELPRGRVELKCVIIYRDSCKPLEKG